MPAMAKSTIVHVNVSSDYGGGPRVMWEIINALKDNYRHIIIAPKGPYIEQYRNIGLNTYTLPIRSLDPKLIFRIAIILRKERARLVHTHGKGAGIWGRLAGWLAGVPAIHTYHGLHYRDYSPVGRFFYLYFERFLSKITTALVHTGHAEREEANKLKLHSNGPRVYTIYNGVDVTKITALAGTAPPQFVSCSITYIIMIGRLLTGHKNQELALKILKHLPSSYTLVIVGEGPDREKLKLRITNYQLRKRVRLMGALDYKTALKELNKADIYLSTSRWEGLPLTILEAGALEKPVVASDIPAHRDIIAHEQNGLLFPINQPAVAVKYIKKLHQTPELGKKLGKALRETVQTKFSLNNMINNYHNLYEKIIAAHYRTGRAR